MNQILSCIEIEPACPAKKSMIWLHGLGADGNDFVPFISELNPSFISDMRLIFPHAPVIPITINNGYAMRAWYDIYGLTPEARIDITGIDQSIRHVENLINKEISLGIPASNIFVGGFSQGAALAFLAGLTRQGDALAGLLALSGYLPLTPELKEKMMSARQTVPIFQAHGTLDPIVPYGLGKASYDCLTQMGHAVDWHSYPITHSVSQEELQDMNTWLDQVSKQK